MYKNKAFISYRHSSRDKKIAEMIQRKLEHYRIPKDIASKYGIRKIGRIFRDQTDLGARPDLTEELRRELDESEYLIVICSPDTADSRWVSREIKYFLEHHDVTNILPVLADGDPLIVLPKVFGGLEGVPAELAACDFSGQRGYWGRREISRLASALIGCSYDELIKREQRFRLIRVLAVSATAICLLAGASAYHYVSSMRLKKSRDEKLISDAKRFAAQSEISRQNREWFDALRYALEAFPEGGDNGPVAGEAVYALQQAVHAYSPGASHSFVQTGEFSTGGMIDDWSCLETNEGTWLAVLFDDYEEYVLDVWDVKKRDKLFEAKSSEVFNELLAARAEESDSSMAEDIAQGYSFLLTDGTVLWACGDRLVSIDFKTGDLLWKRRLDGAYQLTLLTAGRNMLAIHVCKESEEEKKQREYIQIHSLDEGSLIGRIEVGLTEGKGPAWQDGYSEIPRAVFAEAEQETLLIFEEDFHYYDESEADSTLRLVHTNTMTSSTLTENAETADFVLLDNSRVLAAVRGEMANPEGNKDALRLKCLDLKADKEDWSADIRDTTGEYVHIIPGDSPVLISGMHAAAYDVESGREICSTDFPSFPVSASLSQAPHKKSLTVLSEDGNYYIWDMKHGDLLPIDSVFPTTISRAEQLGNTILLYNTDESRNISGDRISMFQRSAGDPDLCKVDIHLFGAGEEKAVFHAASCGTKFVFFTEEGSVHCIDAVDGTEEWTVHLGSNCALEDVSEDNERMLFYSFSESSEDGSKAGHSWTILNMESGKTRQIQVPDPDETSGSSHIECCANSLSGNYVVSIVSEADDVSGSDQSGRTCLVRYPLGGTGPATPEIVDITDTISVFNKNITLSGNQDGSKAVCLCSKGEANGAGLLLYIDWATQKLQTLVLENGTSDASASLIKWSPDGRNLIIPDENNDLCMIALGDGNIRSSSGQFIGDGTSGGKQPALEASRALIAGYDYYNNNLVVVEVRDNRLWARDQENKIDFALPVSEDNALDPEALFGMKMWTSLAVEETRDGRLLLSYGDEAFVIVPGDNTVESAVEDFLCYNQQTDTLLLHGDGELYISRRYSVQELVAKGKKILEGAK